MDLLGTTLNQRFRLDLEIGRGGFGVVYRATDLHLGREVAVKVLFSQLASDDSIQRFLREAQVSSQLQDQHIITTFDFGIYTYHHSVTCYQPNDCRGSASTS